MLYIITVFEEAIMTPRFNCPHCHSSIDPQTMDPACSSDAQFRICPDCDEPVVLALSSTFDDLHPTPTVAIFSRAFIAGSCTP